MSLVSALSPSGLPYISSKLGAEPESLTASSKQVPFHHEAAYITLYRMLLRFQHLILLAPEPSSSFEESSSPLQRQVQAELYSPISLYRKKWLHNIERARTLLLQLERLAQGIKVQSAKSDASRDLAEKRSTIKRLRARVEEIGREVEAEGPKAWQRPNELEGISAWDLLQKHRATIEGDVSTSGHADADLRDGKPVINVEEDDSPPTVQESDPHHELFNTDSTMRNRGKKHVQVPEANKGKTSGYSDLPSTERALFDQSRTQEDITTSLVSMAAQLKQQSRAFQFTLDQDKGLLDRALEGLDKNLSGMEAASKNMAFLKRMSEEEGWLGRLKLYAMIFGMWVAAILLVFVMPKLRFSPSLF